MYLFAGREIILGALVYNQASVFIEIDIGIMLHLDKVIAGEIVRTRPVCRRPVLHIPPAHKVAFNQPFLV
jgi:hypothetical protein